MKHENARSMYIIYYNVRPDALAALSVGRCFALFRVWVGAVRFLVN